MKLCCFVGFCLLAAINALLAQAQSVQSAAYWVQELGAYEFQQREYAAKQLLKLGPPAESVLETALADDDLEVRARCERLLYQVRLTKRQTVPEGWDLVWTQPRSTMPNQYNHGPWQSGSVLLIEDGFKLIALDGRLGRPLWELPLFGSLAAIDSPIQADEQGFVFVDARRTVSYLHAITGRTLWRHETNQPMQRWFLRDGLFIGVSSQQIVAIDVRSGEWLYQNTLEAQFSPLGCGTNQVLFWNSRIDRVALAPVHVGKFQTNWKPAKRGRPYILLSGDAERMLILDARGPAISSYSSKDGTLQWHQSAELPSELRSHINLWNWFTVHENWVLSPVGVRMVETGQPVWSYELPTNEALSYQGSDNFGGPPRRYFSPPCTDGKLLFSGDLSGQLHALDLANGHLEWIWQADTEGQLYRCLPSKTRLFVASENWVHCLRRQVD